MRQLYVFCEGQTEQGFCTQVLQPHLFPLGDGVIHTLAVGQKDHHHVYGIGRRTKYEKVRKFILNTIKQRAGQEVYFTTLFDLYALPNDFPGKNANVRNVANPTPYVVALEAAFGADINYFRFIPYLQLHEYETILFADPDSFAYSFENCAAEIQELKVIAASEPSIENINDGSDSAPSKRIISVIPEYDGRKASAGPDIAEYTGVAAIRAKCPHFDGWFTQLENIQW
jgi:hypothetical protein